MNKEYIWGFLKYNSEIDNSKGLLMPIILSVPISYIGLSAGHFKLIEGIVITLMHLFTIILYIIVNKYKVKKESFYLCSGLFYTELSVFSLFAAYVFLTRQSGFSLPILIFCIMFSLAFSLLMVIIYNIKINSGSFLKEQKRVPSWVAGVSAGLGFIVLKIFHETVPYLTYDLGFTIIWTIIFIMVFTLRAIPQLMKYYYSKKIEQMK